MRLILAVILAGAAAVGGCVEREMIITSDPVGALVFISDREIGRTPVTQEFLWYGDYEIRLSCEGYETLNTHRNLRSPWYETVPLDFLSAVAPWTYHDRRYLHFELNKSRDVSSDELLQQTNADLLRRAEELRRKNDQPVKK